MPARRYKSLHHNLQEGQNVVFHREHRSKKNRSVRKTGVLQKWEPSDRHKWKTILRHEDFLASIGKRPKKRKQY